MQKATISLQVLVGLRELPRAQPYRYYRKNTKQKVRPRLDGQPRTLAELGLAGKGLSCPGLVAMQPLSEMRAVPARELCPNVQSPCRLARILLVSASCCVVNAHGHLGFVSSNESNDAIFGMQSRLCTPLRRQAGCGADHGSH